MIKEKVFEIVKNNILAVLPNLNAEQISIDKALKDLGANSIDRMEIMMISMEDIGIKMPLTELAKASNIEKLVDILISKQL